MENAEAGMRNDIRSYVHTQSCRASESGTCSNFMYDLSGWRLGTILEVEGDVHDAGLSGNASSVRLQPICKPPGVTRLVHKPSGISPYFVFLIHRQVRLPSIGAGLADKTAR